MAKEIRPRLKVTLSRPWKVFRRLPLAVFVLGIAYILLRYPHLPDRIPSHFNASGVPDGWSSKNALFIVPLFAIVLYFSIDALLAFPHQFNYTRKITEENAEPEYRRGMHLLIAINFNISLIFLCICILMIELSGHHPGTVQTLAAWSVPVILFLALSPLLFYFIRK